jgi:hypothetical protein
MPNAYRNKYANYLTMLNQLLNDLVTKRSAPNRREQATEKCGLLATA